MIADLLGRPIVLHLTPGHHADIRVAADLLGQGSPKRKSHGYFAQSWFRTGFESGNMQTCDTFTSSP